MVLKYRVMNENSYKFMTQNVLALDTALSGCNVALLKGGLEGACYIDRQAMARGQSEVLVPMVQGVLSQGALAFSDLDLIVTTVGPGAFTGLRIGLSTARGFAVALGIPLVGLTTLEVLAQQYEGDQPCAIILETKRDDFYVQVFGKEKKPLTEHAVLDREAVSALLQEYKGVVLAGDATERFMEQETEDYIVIRGINAPDPVVMARLALVRFQEGSGREAVPLYLRGADVSVRKTPLRVLASS